MLTEEDNKKIQESWKHKTPILMKNGPRLSEIRKPDSKESVGLWIEKHTEQYPNRVKLMYEDEIYTHTEFNEWCNRYANYFLKLGLKKGDVVVVLMNNRPDILFIIVAMSKIGTIASMINTNLREDALIHCITHAPGSAIIVEEELFQPFEEVKSRLNLNNTQKQRVYFLPDKEDTKIPEGYLNIRDEIKDSEKTNPSTTPEMVGGNTFVYVFTSGTTGLPKASIIKNSAILAAGIFMGNVVLEITLEDVVYCTTPLFHSNGLIVGFGNTLAQGSALALRRKFSVSNFWADTRKHGATIFNYVGEICRYLYNQPPNPDDLNNPVKHMIGSGLRYDMWKPFKKRFGIETVREQYGASETAVPGFFNIHNIDETCGVSISKYGLVKYDVDADEAVRNEKGYLIKVKPGETGLLLGKIEDIDNFFMYKDKKATEKKVIRNVFRKGDAYLNTGDLLKDIGYGHVQFVDRIGDTFRWKSENVSTDQVENVISTYEQIYQNAVYGVRIPNTEGRAGMVSLVIKSGEDLDFNGFLNFLKKQLPSYAVPLIIRIKKNLEVTATHKIKKGGLKEEGYNIERINDPIYILLPKSKEYVPMTNEIYKGISEGKYAF